MRTLIPFASTILVIAVVAGLYSGCEDGVTMDPYLTSSRPQISVTLLSPATAVTGIPVPSGLERLHFEYLRIKDPSDVTITLPDNAQKQLTAKYASIVVTYGTVTGINVLPLLKSTPYKEALAELHRLLAVMEIMPDERMKQKMKEWPDDLPGFDPVKQPGYYPHRYRTGMTLQHDLDFDVGHKGGHRDL